MFSSLLLQKLQKSTSVGGLTSSSLVLLFEKILKTKRRNLLVCFRNRHEAYEFYSICVDYRENLFGFFPEGGGLSSVPGFDLDKKRFTKESVVNLSLKQPFCCIGTKRSFNEDKIPNNIKKNTQISVFRIGDSFSIDYITDLLLGFGFEKKDISLAPGQFSTRGDIVDVFPFHFKNPFRISFEYDTIGSLSVFDPVSQLAIQHVKKVFLSEHKKNTQSIDNINLIDLFPESLFFKVEKKSSGLTVSPNKSLNHIDLGFVELQTAGSAEERKTNVFEKSSAYKKTFYIGENPNRLFPYQPNKVIRGFIRSGFYSKNRSVFVVSENDIFSFNKQKNRWAPLVKDASLNTGKAFFSQITTCSRLSNKPSIL